MKLDPADTVFSQYIRLRDGMCVRGGSLVRYNEQGLPITHQNSHYFGRGKEATRYDPENCDTLCDDCHKRWEGPERKKYKQFKIKQLGVKRFQDLELRSNSYYKKNRKDSLLEARRLLKSIK